MSQDFWTARAATQEAVVAGGRYDGLVEAMGGRATPGVGWAAGLERLVLLIEEEEAVSASLPRCRGQVWRTDARAWIQFALPRRRPVAVISGDRGSEAGNSRAVEDYCLSLLSQLRRDGIYSVFDFEAKPKVSGSPNTLRLVLNTKRLVNRSSSRAPIARMPR